MPAGQVELLLIASVEELELLLRQPSHRDVHPIVGSVLVDVHVPDDPVRTPLEFAEEYLGLAAQHARVRRVGLGARAQIREGEPERELLLNCRRLTPRVRLRALGEEVAAGATGRDRDEEANERDAPQRVCGNPRSTWLVAGSGHRLVTTFPRV